MSRPTTTERPAPYRPDSSDDTVRSALRNGRLPIAVYGLGKIGLPVAAVFAEVTGNVTGVDTDPAVVETVRAGDPPFEHEPELEDVLPTLVADEALAATTDGRAAAEAARIHVIVVPVPLTDANEAELGAVDAVVETIAEGLAPGDLVVVETTVPPGTSEARIQAQLAEQSGIDPDAFGVACCPERTSSGRALTDVRGAYPRVIGGVDPASTDAVERIYDELIDNRIIPVDARTAEAVKLFEGVYRDVNIALANELALAFDGTGIDVRDAIAAANTQPYCDIHDPGAGVGGHCIPWYPHFLMQAGADDMPLVWTARQVNERMPDHLAQATISALRARGISPTEASVAVLGLAYRPEIPETAASPAIPLIEHLDGNGIQVAVVDPVLDASETEFELLAQAALPDFDPDAVVLVTPHAAFDQIPDGVLEEAIVIDGRDALDGTDRAYVIGRDP